MKPLSKTLSSHVNRVFLLHEKIDDDLERQIEFLERRIRELTMGNALLRIDITRLEREVGHREPTGPH